MSETPTPETPENELETSMDTAADPTVGSSMTKNSLLLGLFALVTAGLLATTYTSTADRIAAAERANAQRALLEVVPLERHDNDLLATTQAIADNYWKALGLKKGGDMHIATLNDKPVAVIMPATAPDGYSGDIRMIIGINLDGSLAGVRVLSHAETPGLGDKIDLNKSDWILSFDGKSLSNPKGAGWAVKKDGGDFDQFAGATITPRAVVNQVKRALEVYRASQPLRQLEQQSQEQSTASELSSSDVVSDSPQSAANKG